MSDLNEVFGTLFAESLRPLVRRIAQLEIDVHTLIEMALEGPPEVEEYGPRGSAAAAVCGSYPPKDGLFGDQQWTPCDLPWEHDGPHNASLVV